MMGHAFDVAVLKLKSKKRTAKNILWTPLLSILEAGASTFILALTTV